MEILKIIALCLSCFSLGISLTGLTYVIIAREKGNRRKRK